MSALRILLLEDNRNDAALIQDLLEADHFVCEIIRVQTRPEFVDALGTVRLDLILADYQLPSFDGLSALKLALNSRPEVPFIFVSGTLGEELAVEALKIGATDYVLKTRLSRLVPAVQRALREATERAERKKAVEALRRSEMYLAEAQRLSHTGSFGWHVSSGELVWSDETYRIFECDPAVDPTVPMMIERTHPDDRIRLQQIIQRAATERRAFTAEHRLVMTNGSVKYVRAVAHGVTGGDSDDFLFVGAVTDITERKRTEETLREQARDLAEREAKIRRLVDANIVGIFIWDLKGQILEANDAFLRIVGYDRDDLASGRLHWTELTPPEWLDRDRERWVPEIKVSGILQPFEKEYFRKDGSRVPVLIGAASFDESGRQGAAFVLDLTERKRAEVEVRKSEQRYREMQMALAHANRVTTMGHLAASISHEIKQPIAANAVNAQAGLRWLSARPPNLEEARQAFDRIIQDAMRASEVTNRIRGLVKNVPPRKERLQINEAIGEVIALTRGEAEKYSVSVRMQLAEDLPLVEGDRVQLQQVMLNLVVNAIEAASTVDEGPRELAVGTSKDESGSALIAVRDSGPGVAPQNVERLFEPFYTTKAGGMGMGLSICRSIVEAHGGRIWVSGNVPHGAAFQFTVPAQPSNA
jgi:PAS domain S-box-containing protein